MATTGDAAAAPRTPAPRNELQTMRLARAVAELRALTEHETAGLASLTDRERAEQATTLGQLLTLAGKYLGVLGLHLAVDSYADMRACATTIGELERAALTAHHLAKPAAPPIETTN